MTTAKSAFPASIEDLLPQARQLARRLGGVPSQNRLKSDLCIGADKAKLVKARLLDETAPEADGPTRLRVVPEPDPVPEPDAGDEPEEPDESSSASAWDQVPEGAEDRPELDSEATEPPSEVEPEEEASEHASTVAEPVAEPVREEPRRGPRAWPVLLLALPAFVAIWSGWVGLGGLTGFGLVHPLPGIADGLALNTAITLPIGVETYAAYALRVWLSGQVPPRARRFAKYSALGSLVLGALGQIAYHLMTAAGLTQAPWPITTAVACLPVAVLGMGAGLTHLLHDQGGSR